MTNNKKKSRNQNNAVTKWGNFVGACLPVDIACLAPLARSLERVLGHTYTVHRSPLADSNKITSRIHVEHSCDVRNSSNKTM